MGSDWTTWLAQYVFIPTATSLITCKQGLSTSARTVLVPAPCTILAAALPGLGTPEGGPGGPREMCAGADRFINLHQLVDRNG